MTSLEGHGTTFTVCLPLGKDHLQTNEIIEKKNVPIGSNRHTFQTVDMSMNKYGLPVETETSPERERHRGIDDTIVLTIENNADVRAYIREHLETAYKIIEAQDGEEGLESALEIIPDLIIRDVMMPKKNGYHCHRRPSAKRTVWPGATF